MVEAAVGGVMSTDANPSSLASKMSSVGVVPDTQE
jgi:hypothetical protein